MRTETLLILGVLAYLYFSKTKQPSPGYNVGSGGTGNVWCLDATGTAYFVGTGPCANPLPTPGAPTQIPAGLQAYYD